MNSAQWNAPFRALFPDGIPPYTPLLVSGGSSGSPSPDLGSWWEAWPPNSPFHESPNRCFIIQDSGATWQLAVYRGGSVEEFGACFSVRFGLTPFYALLAGRRHQYTWPESSARLAEHFSEGIPAGTPFYVKAGSRGHGPAETCLLGTVKTGWSLVTYNEDGADLYMLDSCARSRGVAWIRRFDNWQQTDYRVGSVTTANAFRGWHIPSLMPLLVYSFQPPVAAPDFEFPSWSDTWVDADGGIHGEPWESGCFRTLSVARSDTDFLAVYRGGTFDELDSCLDAHSIVRDRNALIFTVQDRSWIYRSRFDEAFESGVVPAGTAFYIILLPDDW